MILQRALGAREAAAENAFDPAALVAPREAFFCLSIFFNWLVDGGAWTKFATLGVGMAATGGAAVTRDHSILLNGTARKSFSADWLSPSNVGIFKSP